MRTNLQCKHCSTRLAAKIELQGKYVRCPRCRNPVKVALKPVVLQALGTQPAADEPIVAIPIEDEAVEAVQLPTIVGPEVIQEVPPDEPDESAPKLKPRKKKKKARQVKSEGYPAWVWALFLLGAVVTTTGLVGGLYLALRAATPAGMPIPWKEYVIAFGISMAITLVILILSMFISSALGGGINFGDAKTAIIGSIFLIIIVNLVNLIPVVGRYLTLIVWLVGFMTIFGLDPWEARFLLVINWVLNYAVGFAIFHYIINRLDRDDSMDIIEIEIDPDKPGLNKSNRKGGQRDQRKDPDGDDDLSYYRPQLWHDQMSAWVKAQYS